MTKRLAMALLVVALIASWSPLGARDCVLVDMINVTSSACCENGSHWRCCCTDCHGRYDYYSCGGVVHITAYCCAL